MTTPAKILLIGNDMAHLQTRADVLHHFWAIATASPDQMALPIAETDLAVVCHTIPEPERQRIVDAIRHQEPNLLLVKMNGYDSGPHANADATVDVLSGPGALVATLYSLLTERGLHTKGWVEQEMHVGAMAIH